MPYVSIDVAGRNFKVACQPGEQEQLGAAATILSGEARQLTAQIGRIPESQMLLMSGLILADKILELQRSLQNAVQHSESLQQEIEAIMRNGNQNSATLDSVRSMFENVAEQAEQLSQAIESGDLGGKIELV